MEQIITKAIELIVLLISFLIGRYLIPLLKEKVNMQTLNLVMGYSKEFVQYAEQFLSDKTGAEKKEIVLALLVEKAIELGIDISEEDLSSLIESAVYTMKNARKDY